MGLLNKLMFWKKDDDEFDFDHLASKDMGNLSDNNLGLDQQAPSPFSEPPAASPYKQSFNPPATPAPTLAPNQFSGASRDMELINTKLDTIKAMLNSMEQRLSNIEKSSVSSPREKLW